MFAQARLWSLHQLRLFFIALQFFTRIPVPRWVGFEEDWLHHAARYFVLVGFVVGASAAAVYFGAALLLPQLLAVLLATIATIVLTGAFHEDGFADVCDGLGGTVSAERALEIMKDSRIGAYGAIGMTLMLALKISALFYLSAHAAMAAMLVAHPLSRLASSTLIWRLHYVRAEGKAKPLAERMTGGEWLTAALFATLPVTVCVICGWLNWQSLAAGLGLLVLASCWLTRIFIRRLGGYTGDCLGAIQQVAEVSFYLGVVAVLNLP